ncbi:MAG: hypothetical protein ACJ746_20045 [Bryobacteraceae bacterium]
MAGRYGHEGGQRRGYELAVKHASLCAAVGLLAFAVPFQAHDVIATNLTFARDVSRIFASRCGSCHSSGSSIPLITYEEARPWAVSIKEQVLSRAMPPWGAVKGFGDLSPDNSLTQEEIMIIAAWVVGGAPEGNPASLPKPSAVIDTAPPTPLVDALVIETRARLAKGIDTSGVKPIENRTISSAKIIARLPSAEVLPMVWLYRFDGRSKRIFSFRSPVYLPPGTIVEASSPLRFALEGRIPPNGSKW